VAELILALDLPGPEARRLLDRIPEARWVKVGAILFAREGPALIRDLVARGLKVFLDLKWHDIPHSVAEAVAAARELRVAMATVHTIGGEAMMAAAAQAAGPDFGIVGVTVLTSHTADSYATAVGRPQVIVREEVARLSAAAIRSGLRGVVCSPLEVALARGVVGPAGWIVVPGIRRSDDRAGDQMRVATPAEAALAGATHLVVGRPILQAADPASAFREIAEEAG
jgi:orotidine-5'-phosphate decarboxylase